MTQGEMYPLIKEWQESGQKIAKFCVAHQIKRHTFSYWHQKYRKEKRVTTGGFTQVQITPSVGTMPVCLEMQCPNGIRLNFSKLPEASYVTGLIKGMAQ